MKKRAYNDWIIEVEKGTFSPLVFSCSGGASAEATKFIKQLSTKLSEKRQEQYSATVNFVRRWIRFDILRSCIYSLRGERSRRGGAADENLTELEMGLHRLSAEWYLYFDIIIILFTIITFLAFYQIKAKKE